MYKKKTLCVLVAALMLVSLSPVQVHAAGPPCVQIGVTTNWTCSVPLVNGWNLISLPVVPNMTANANSVDLLFNQTGLSWVTSVFTFTVTKGVGAWQFCAPKLAAAKWSCVGTLKFMVDGAGYWVLTKGPGVALKFVGSVIPPASAPPAYALSAGWNLVGYKPQPIPLATVAASVYLSSLSPNYDPNNVWIYIAVAGIWSRTDAAPLAPGNAMWVLMSTADTLYP